MTPPRPNPSPRPRAAAGSRCSPRASSSALSSPSSRSPPLSFLRAAVDGRPRTAPSRAAGPPPGMGRRPGRRRGAAMRSSRPALSRPSATSALDAGLASARVGEPGAGDSDRRAPATSYPRANRVFGAFPCVEEIGEMSVAEDVVRTARRGRGILPGLGWLGRTGRRSARRQGSLTRDQLPVRSVELAGGTGGPNRAHPPLQSGATGSWSSTRGSREGWIIGMRDLAGR